MRNLILWSMVFIAFVLTGCSSEDIQRKKKLRRKIESERDENLPEFVGFKHSYRKEYGLDEKTLKNIQYYISDELILRRELPAGESTVTEGKVVVELGKKVEKIVIPKETPGILEKAAENEFWVSFSEGSSLRFKKQYAYCSGEYGVFYGVSFKSDNEDDEFKGDDEDENESDKPASVLKEVEFSGNTYQVIGERVYLLIKRKMFLALDEQVTTLKGRKIDEKKQEKEGE